jgi:PAS domain S-box-containing protein
VYADLWKAISAGGEWRGELCNRKKNGELYWEQAAISGLQGEDGQITHYIAVKEDITERKRAEQELARESQRSTLLLRNASDGVHILDRDGKVLEVSDSFCEMLGYSREELIGANVALWDARWSPLELKQLFDQQVDAVERSVFETRHRRRDGSVFDVEVIRQRIELDGKFVLYNSSRDITERKRTDAALRASEEKFAKAFRSSPMFISISTVADGRYIEVNEGFLRGTGHSREEVIGQTSGDIALWKNSQDRQRAIDALLKDGRLSGFEAELRKKSGELMVCEIWAEPIEIEGSPYVIWVTNDVTARKKADAAREQLALQLRESQKMEAIGTLAGGIAHDFNNLLAVILGNIALARQDVAPDSELTQSLREIEKAAQRAKGLVLQILAFSRRQAHELANQALRPPIDEAIRLLRATLPAGVELIVAVADEPIYVRCDANQIEQVLMNLCTNAWQALEGKPGRIEIRLEAVWLDAAATQGLGGLEPGNFARLTVTDNGVGMDEVTRARIFEPFFTTKEPGQGTGLGLAVVHGIVKGHNGAIEVRSAPGKGTTITVHLPVSAELADAMQAAPESAAAQGNGKRILYLDDEEAMVVLVQRMLNRLGYRTSGYLSAEEALSAVRTAPDAFDLVVTDLNMPGLSGLDVARELKRIRPDLPVVITSGYITEDVREKALQEGVRQVVYKPNTVDELCQSIHELLTGETGPG